MDDNQTTQRIVVSIDELGSNYLLGISSSVDQDGVVRTGVANPILTGTTGALMDLIGTAPWSRVEKIGRTSS